jgi:hypothetical protein
MSLSADAPGEDEVGKCKNARPCLGVMRSSLSGRGIVLALATRSDFPPQLETNDIIPSNRVKTSPRPSPGRVSV